MIDIHASPPKGYMSNGRFLNWCGESRNDSVNNMLWFNSDRGTEMFEAWNFIKLQYIQGQAYEGNPDEGSDTRRENFILEQREGCLDRDIESRDIAAYVQSISSGNDSNEWPFKGLHEKFILGKDCDDEER